ncbi:helix-turn-helix domain-containing protein [Streptomyces sp. NPDC051771]|uniref:helix-turn-helix domain-containing protein n=1 Tax=Streptomyces sp. NPDC051771 TaxID=3154847 RepID=UPI0034430EE7
MKRFTEAERFSSRLRELRERADYSYETLARKTGVSRSSLHRYCAGASVPPDYGLAHRIGVACGATPTELRELHRLWALADTERNAESPESRENVAEAAEASPVPAPEPVPVPVPAPAPVPASVSAPESVSESLSASEDGGEMAPDEAAAGRGPHRWRLTVIGAVTALVLSLTAWGLVSTFSPTATDDVPTDARPLFTDACGPVVSMGQNDACVREVQLRLREHGARIGVDGSFGPETLRRVTAFQVLTGLVPNGVVGAPTKKALYESPVRMETWSPERVRQRVREVFAEVPDDAVAIADCQSFLDPLHILPNTNGTRNWGLFQISDARLAELGGTPGQALDPEWNIQAARKLWSRDRDFGDWPHCERALRPSAKSSS